MRRRLMTPQGYVSPQCHEPRAFGALMICLVSGEPNFSAEKDRLGGLCGQVRSMGRPQIGNLDCFRQNGRAKLAVLNRALRIE